MQTLNIPGAIELPLTSWQTPTYANSTADPREYAYHPLLGNLALGRGFNPQDPSEPKNQALAVVEERLDHGAVSYDLQVLYVRNQLELSIALGLDISAEVRYLGNSAKGRYESNESTSFNSDSQTFVLHATANFGRWALKQPKLNNEAKALMSDPAAFAKRYGTRYVDMEWRGHGLSAIITIISVSEKFKKSINTSMEASGGWGQMSAKATAAFSTELSKASKDSRVVVQVTGFGGEGFGPLSKIVEGLTQLQDPLPKISAALAQHLETLKAENAVVLKYVVGSMGNFGLDEKRITPWSDAKEEILEMLVERFRRVERALDIAKKIVADPKHPLAQILGQHEIALIPDQIKSGEDYLDVLKQRHKLALTKGPDEPIQFPEMMYPDIDLFDYLMEPPFIEFTCMVSLDGNLKELRPEDVITILNVLPADRMSIMNHIVGMENVKGFIVGLTTNGHGLVSIQSIFWYQPEGNIEASLATPIHTNGAISKWWETDESNGMESFLFDWLSEWKGNGTIEGIFILRFKDVFHRTMDIELFNIKWRLGTGPEKITYEI